MGAVVQTTLRFPKELLRRLKQACLDRNTNQTTAVIEAVEAWLGPEDGEQILFQRAMALLRDDDVELFTDFLQNGDPAFVKIVMDILAVHRERKIEEKGGKPRRSTG